MEPRKVFICYAHEDRYFVENLAPRLEAVGVVVWYDRHLTPGSSWSVELEVHIREAVAVVVVLSPASARSDYVRKEVQFAQEVAKVPMIIPLLVRTCDIPLPLSGLQWVDGREGQNPLPGVLAALTGRPSLALQPPEVLPTPPPPLELRLSISGHPQSYQTSVVLPDNGVDAGPFMFTPPLSLKDLAELSWYLESYWRWPVGPEVERASRLERNLKQWGRVLFQAVFLNPYDTNSEAIRLWQQFRDRTDHPHLLTLDSTDPVILGLPWELIADEDGHVFAMGITMRRRIHKVQAAPNVEFDLPVQILMVVARPNDSRTPFIDARASPQALLEAVAPLGTNNAVIEFLHPPTLKALDDRLRDRKRPGIHVVHFDGHGFFSSERGLGYLAFENDHGGLDADADSDRLGTLLAAANVPLVVLDACQSAHARAPDPFSSVAPRLIQAGVGSVVAMQYSVMVETSRRFFGAFYQALARGRTVGQAMDEGRRTLLANTFRFSLYYPDAGEVPLNLRDWFVPVLYQQKRDLAPLAGAVIRPTVEAKKAPTLHGNFPRTHFRFTGRAWELWRLERLLRERRIVIVHGFGGQGKTALASEAARWLTHTGLFARALFLSFEEGGDADWAVIQMGRLLLGNDFYALPQAERLSALKRTLAAAPTCVVWDNFESVLPGWHAELPTEVLQELLDLGVELTDSGITRLVVTTRNPDFAHRAYTPSRSAAILEPDGLKGLIPQDALTFVGEILDTLGHERPERPHLEQLLEFLGGHPLSIQLVIPHLKEYNNDVARVIEEYEELYPGFAEGKARERNESLDVSLSFSLSRLSKVVRERLPALGVFDIGALETNILIVSELRPSQWKEVRAELVRAGLATPVAELPHQIPTEEGPFKGCYIHFHPTLVPYLRSRQTPEARLTLEERYRQIYHALCGMITDDYERAPRQIVAIVRNELPNLRRALDLTLAAGDIEEIASFAKDMDRVLAYLGRWRERKALLARIEHSVKRPSDKPNSPMTKPEYLLMMQRGWLLLDEGKAHPAEQVFRQLLTRMDCGMAYGGVSAFQDRSNALSMLARSLFLQGRLGDSEAAYSHALTTLVRLNSEERSVRGMIERVHSDLASVLAEDGKYPEAHENLEAALGIAKELNNVPGVALILGQFGTLARKQKNFPEARRRHREARNFFRTLGDVEHEAVACSQLGMVALEEVYGVSSEERTACIAEAEEAYFESLRLSHQLGNKRSAAGIANQLGTIAAMANRYADAERWYWKALENFEVLVDPHAQAKVLTNLAMLFLKVDRLHADRPPDFARRDLLAEAEALAHRAREIWESFIEFSNEIWKAYGALAEIAQTKREGKKALYWKRKEFAAVPGNWEGLAPEWEPLIQVIVAANAGDEMAKGIASDIVAQIGLKRGRPRLADALSRVLAGERSADSLAESYSLEAEEYLITIKILKALT